MRVFKICDRMLSDIVVLNLLSSTGDQCLHYIPRPYDATASSARCSEIRPLLGSARSGSERGARCVPMPNCADVTDAFSSIGNGGRCGGRCPGEDDDAATTTSGSYVVDARELCNEIDQVFFAGV